MVYLCTLDLSPPLAQDQIPFYLKNMNRYLQRNYIYTIQGASTKLIRKELIGPNFIKKKSRMKQAVVKNTKRNLKNHYFFFFLKTFCSGNNLENGQIINYATVW